MSPNNCITGQMPRLWSGLVIIPVRMTLTQTMEPRPAISTLRMRWLNATNYSPAATVIGSIPTGPCVIHRDL